MPRALFIKSPRLGVLNLAGPIGDAAAAEDLAGFGGLFTKVPAPAEGSVPKCDVLLVYCELERNGALRGSEARLVDLLHASGARVAILASNNAGDAYAAATKGIEWPCTIVETIDRRGTRFAPFFKKVFSEMFVGTPMPAAWAKHAPPVPDRNLPWVVLAGTPAHVTFEM